MAQGKRHTDEDLRLVADAYMKAHNEGIPVQRAVADAFGIPISTATKQIMEARERGYLPSKEEVVLMRKYQKAKNEVSELERLLNNLSAHRSVS